MISAEELVDPPKLNDAQASEFGEYIHRIMESYEGDRNGRIKKVQQYRAFHNDDFSSRRVAGSVFEKSNIGVPVCKAIAVTYAAKLYNALTGPNKLQVTPHGPEDRPASINYQKYWDWELDDEINMPLRRARECDVLASEGTCITKRFWKRRASYFKRKRQQLHGPDGEPMSYPDGKPITPDMQTMLEAPSGLGALIGMGPSVHIAFGGQPFMRFDKNSMRFDSVEFQDRIVHYNNADLDIVSFESFVCDMKVAHIDDSLLVAHLYDCALWDMMQRVEDDRLDYQTRGIQIPRGHVPPGWIVENLRKLASIASGKPTMPAHQSKPIEARGESTSADMPFIDSQDGAKTLNLAEGHIRYDIDNDGWPEDVMFLYEKTNHLVVWCDYLINQYADCQRPFTVHTLIPVKDRWYGMGPYEFMEASQEFMDRCFNRMNYRNAMSANPAGWHDPSVFDIPPETDGPGAEWIVKAGMDGARGRGFYVMPQMERNEQYFIDIFMSLMRLVSGVTNPAAGEMSNLPSQATATGTTQIIQEGNMHFNMLTQGPADSMSKETAGIIRLRQQNFDEDRVFRFDQGAVKVVQTVTRQDIQDLKFDVRIRVDRNAIQVRADLAKAGMQIVQGYVELPASYQLRMRNLFIMALQAVGIEEAEDVLPTKEELEKDQNNDAVLGQAASKIGENVTRLRAMGKYPLAAVADALMGIVPMLQKVMVQPPQVEEQQGGEMGGEQPGAGEGPQGVPVMTGAPGAPMGAENEMATPTEPQPIQQPQGPM